MTPAARLSAAVDILDEWQNSDLPVDRVVESWGRRHRFAGSKDRAAIAERVFGIFRRRGDIEAFMKLSAPRALVLGGLRVVDGLSSDDISALCVGPYGPKPLEDAEVAALARPVVDKTQNLPTWLVPLAQESLGDRLEAEVEHLLQRAPIDLRVNRLKATPEEARRRLAAQGIESEPCRYAPDGLRLARPVRLDDIDVMTEGWIEPQDEGSQIVTGLVDAQPGQRVLDLCAGAGGKSLALAAIMNNQGEICAHDIDPRRLARLDPRAHRAGIKIIRVGTPSGLYDRVVIDAPCTGSGTWRRAPDARWRLTPSRFEALQATQTKLLARGADLTAPGGRLTYITCSWLKEENGVRIEEFLARHPDFVPVDWRGMPSIPPALPDVSPGPGLVLSTAVHGTDGFYGITMQRQGAAL